jgi:hypothetical protein
VHCKANRRLRPAAYGPETEREAQVALSEAGARGAARTGALAFIASIAAWCKDASDRSVAQRIAGAAFIIRVASAAIIYLSQVLLARWMGRFEFGIYVYVWAWVGFLGMASSLGIATASQRLPNTAPAAISTAYGAIWLAAGSWASGSVPPLACCSPAALSRSTIPSRPITSSRS